MKLKINNDYIPVLGWCETSECPCYEQLAEDLRNGHMIIYNSIREFDDDELCTFIFYDEYHKNTLYAAFSGTVEFLGQHPDHSAPFAYAFYPEKEIMISCVGKCPDCGDPEVTILKSKKL